MEDWQQLPRPDSVRVLQCVDRAVSKYAVAIEGDGEELERRAASARRLYAAVLAKSLLEYGGQDVGVITYKSTREWIEQNCFVPPWLKLFHHGDVTGTNALQNVRALFVIGRPLASAEAVTRMTEACSATTSPSARTGCGRSRGEFPSCRMPLTTTRFWSTSGSIRTRGPSGCGGR